MLAGVTNTSKRGADEMKRTWTSEELLEHFTLLPNELTAVGNKSGATRLGFAVLLKCLQYEGRFLRSRQEAAPEAVRFLATQVGVDATLFAQYLWEGRTIEAHRAQIREIVKIREFRRADEEALLDWLCTEILPHEQHPERLRELIRAQCRTRGIEAPDDIAALIETGLTSYEAQIYTVIIAGCVAKTRTKARETWRTSLVELGCYPKQLGDQCHLLSHISFSYPL